MTKQDIRSDLHEIHYYYTHREMFEKAGVTVIQSNVLEKIERYAQAIAHAPIRLYMLYVKLYTENNTQLSLAENMGYSEGYIKILNKQLVEYLFAYFTNLEKEEKADDNRRRWQIPSKRAKGYAEDRRAKVHTYGPKEGKELTDFEAGIRSGYLQAQSDHAGIFKYKKALSEGKSKEEARDISQSRGRK